MSEKRVLEISRQLEDLARVAQSVEAKYGAHLGLHSAAALERDKDQLMEHRQALHVLLDRLLDNGERVQVLADELTSLVRGG